MKPRNFPGRVATRRKRALGRLEAHHKVMGGKPGEFHYERRQREIETLLRRLAT